MKKEANNREYPWKRLGDLKTRGGRSGKGMQNRKDQRGSPGRKWKMGKSEGVAKERA